MFRQALFDLDTAADPTNLSPNPHLAQFWKPSCRQSRSSDDNRRSIARLLLKSRRAIGRLAHWYRRLLPTPPSAWRGALACSAYIVVRRLPMCSKQSVPQKRGVPPRSVDRRPLLCYIDRAGNRTLFHPHPAQTAPFFSCKFRRRCGHAVQEPPVCQQPAIVSVGVLAHVEQHCAGLERLERSRQNGGLGTVIT